MVIPDDVRAALVAHAEGEAPNEACGLVAPAGRPGGALRAGRNAASSPYRFELEFDDPEIWFAEDAGYELAVFTRTSPRPRVRRAPTSRTSGSGQGSPTSSTRSRRTIWPPSGSKTAGSKRFRSARNFEEAEHLRLVNRAVELPAPFLQRHRHRLLPLERGVGELLLDLRAALLPLDREVVDR